MGLGVIGLHEQRAIVHGETGEAAPVDGVDVRRDPTVRRSEDDAIEIPHGCIVARTIGSCEHWCNG